MNQPERIHSMDALRASTMFLLIPAHAAGLLAVNGHPGAWATTIFWLIHVFRLPLFFAMSGYFLTLLLNRRGLSRTARNRTVRIVVPLAVGLVTLVPLMFLVSQKTGIAIAAGHRVPEGSPFTFEPSFLWFLWYLLILDGIAVSTYLLAPRLLRSASELLREMISRPMGGIALLAIPTAIALWPAATWTAGPGTAGFVPELPVLGYYALFFCLGATLNAHRDLVSEANRNAWRWTACAVAATVPAGLLFTLHNHQGYGSQPEVHAAALVIYAIATWTSLIALVGLADRYLNRPRPAVRYLADSAYWIYLSHLPAMVLVIAIVGAGSVGLAPQFLIVTAATLAFSLLTYPLFVRYSPIGWILNGRRTRRRPPLWRAVGPLRTPAAVTPPAAAARR
jgi:peptidoglycan/LPS O-acetylase OafA/YrhL